MRLVILSILSLGLFWLALSAESGHALSFLLLGLGLFSVVLVIYIAQRMDKADKEGHPLGRFSWRVVPYYVYLAKEILVSNLYVTRMILFSEKSLKPNVYFLPAKNMVPMEKVTYANSITLTPGTLTLEVGDDWLEVHSLSPELMTSLEQEEMSDRVRTITSHKGEIA